MTLQWTPVSATMWVRHEKLIEELLAWHELSRYSTLDEVLVEVQKA